MQLVLVRHALPELVQATSGRADPPLTPHGRRWPNPCGWATKGPTRWLLLLVLMGAAPLVQAQKYMTRTGTVTFYSTSILEDIEARTDQVAAVVDVQGSQLAFAIPVKSFQFKRTLMQEHRIKCKRHFNAFFR